MSFANSDTGGWLDCWKKAEKGSDDQAMLIHAALQGALQNARAEGPNQFHVVLN